ncbi:hypothetical protein Curi_c12640 [Gottschalkia acidurici 9a]|uniref:Uncharacterized protein n=1 Tax=Gottschalkia acidurici (strain ATCC 7906 / DSM 604 / BCRC 14475 / CIP 104303 / KCTC 5404 / NCIMB 10678 / 9a) TaxID=1128398 RepID=K0AZX3_GOTA9|nr:hypothetical protein [Gottschalkia acidurici]AFS78275.1 hypothetical protein Curi_c12640 [Gottschalkia acidurici 9a]
MKEEYSIIGNKIYIYSIARNDFLQLDTTLYNIRTEVTGAEHATAIRNFNFTRVAYKLEYITSIEAYAIITRLLVTLTYKLATGAILKVLVCNNVYDELSGYEDATEKGYLSDYGMYTSNGYRSF